MVLNCGTETWSFTSYLNFQNLGANRLAGRKFRKLSNSLTTDRKYTKCILYLFIHCYRYDRLRTLTYFSRFPVLPRVKWRHGPHPNVILYIACSGVINYTAFRPQRLSYGFVWFSELTVNIFNVILTLCSSCLKEKVKHKGTAIPAQALKVPGGWSSQISRQSAHNGQPFAPAAFTPQETFLELISVTGWSRP